MSKVIEIERTTALMSSVTKVFPTSYALLYRYHITKNVRNRLKLALRIKKIKGEDGKMIKVGVVVENIMDAWNGVINSSMKELYV